MKHQSDLDKIGEINITIAVKAGVVSFAVSILATAAYVFMFSTKKEFKDDLTFAVTALATSAGITSAFYVGQGIKQSTESQKLDRTLLYIKRWNDPQYLPLRKTAQEIRQLINNHPSGQQEKILREYLELEKNFSKKQDITEVLNFLEEMSVCIEERIVSEDLLHKFFRFIVIRYCETFNVFIAQERNESKSSNLYKCLTDLCEKWRK